MIGIFIAFMIAGLGTLSASEIVYDTYRIVTIGGPVTDIVFALGMGDRVVAVDQSSTRPEIVKELPQVGYIRSISAEGVLSMTPTLIMTTTDLSPPAASDQLKAGGIPVVEVKDPRSATEITAMVNTIGQVLGRRREAQRLVRLLEDQFEEALQRGRNQNKPTVVLFMNSLSQGAMSAAGFDTRADTIIRMAGGKNPFVEHRGYKAVSPEVVLELDPDVILIASNSANADQQLEAIREDPAWKPLTALRDGRLYAADMSYYLSFGSHTGEAVSDLSIKFHGSSGEASLPGNGM